jgi:hypothetical protein
VDGDGGASVIGASTPVFGEDGGAASVVSAVDMVDIVALSSLALLFVLWWRPLWFGGLSTTLLI